MIEIKPNNFLLLLFFSVVITKNLFSQKRNKEQVFTYAYYSIDNKTRDTVYFFNNYLTINIRDGQYLHTFHVDSLKDIKMNYIMAYTDTGDSTLKENKEYIFNEYDMPSYRLKRKGKYIYIKFMDERHSKFKWLSYDLNKLIKSPEIYKRGGYTDKPNQTLHYIKQYCSGDLKNEDFIIIDKNKFSCFSVTGFYYSLNFPGEEITAFFNIKMDKKLLIPTYIYTNDLKGGTKNYLQLVNVLKK